MIKRKDVLLLKEFEQKIKTKKAKVGIVGLGYVGLPLAVEICSSGYNVLGFDPNKEKIKAINEGRSYIVDVPSKNIKNCRKKKKLSATSSFNRLNEMDVICICVPTPLSINKEPDLSFIEKTAEIIKKNLKKGQLIVLESTTFPGTTREVLLPAIQDKDLTVGKDYFLAFSPERVDPGNKKYQIKNTPKVVGGITKICGKAAALFYGNIVDKAVLVSSAEAAEMTKLLENIFRCVNIALVNEIMLLCDRMEIDVWEVIEAASTKPFGFMPFYPGPGLGGHCIPIDPFYLSWRAREFDFRTEFIELAGKTNESIPYYVVTRIFRALNGVRKSVKGSKILILGAAYKKDVGDTRESPALKVIEILLKEGASISIFDPYVRQITVEGRKIVSPKILTKESIRKNDCVIILTDHSGVDYDLVVKEAKIVIDTRNVLKKFKSKNIILI